MKKQILRFTAPRRAKKGFTLLELLVVVLIVGLLAAVAVPQYGRSVRRAEMMEGLAHGKSIYDSALRYKSVNGSAPLSFDNLDVSFPGATATGNTFSDGNFTYTLATDRVVVLNNVSKYRLYLKFPVITEAGVFQEIRCCADANTDKDGVWLCKTPGEGITSGC